MQQNKLPKLAYSEFLSTRDYLQDIAKIVGKVQQLFTAPHPKDWQRGLLVVKQGLSTQPFKVNNKPCTIVLDFRTAELQISNGPSLPLTDSAKSILMRLATWLQKNNVTLTIPEPELSSTSTRFDQAQANNLNIALNWTKQVFESFGQSKTKGNFSPVLLYPHHFDISLVEFFDNKDAKGIEQIGFGFSTGDSTIAEPYFYITAYPEPDGFNQRHLPAPAYWQTQGFSGAVLNYNDIINTDSLLMTKQYLRSIADHYPQ